MRPVCFEQHKSIRICVNDGGSKPYATIHLTRADLVTWQIKAVALMIEPLV
jgi:hypothetical protein